MDQSECVDQPERVVNKRHLAIIVTLLLLSVLTIGCIVPRGDCIWKGKAEAWLDINRNGIIDEGEPPLEGIIFGIDDTLNHYFNVGEQAVSDEEGKADLVVWLPGCPQKKFEIYARAPIGYEPTTKIRISESEYNEDNTFRFGFVYASGVTPTPQPTPTPLQCKKFFISDLISWRYPIAFTDDGITWIATQNNKRPLTRIDSKQEKVIGFAPADEDNINLISINSLAVSDEGNVWIATPDDVIRFQPQQMKWTSYAKSNELHLGKIWNITAMFGYIFADTEAGIEILNKSSEWRVLIDRKELGDRKGDSKFITKDDILFFWSGNKLYRLWQNDIGEMQYNLAWNKEAISEFANDTTIDIDLESEKLMWFLEYNKRQEHFVRKLDISTGYSHEFTYENTGGAIGYNSMNNIVLDRGNNIWINDGSGLIKGSRKMSDKDTIVWTYYHPSNMKIHMLNERERIGRITISPDNALWVSVGKNYWYQCPLPSPPE